MGNGEIWAKCQQCGTELKQGDKVCPKCGSAKHVDRTGHAVLGLKASAGKEHVAPWDGKSISILALIAAAIFPPAVYGIFELLPLSPWLKIAIWLLVVVGLGFIGFWQRYRVLMFTRWLDRKLTARKASRTK